MAKETYVAMFEVAEDSYGVSFPDLPGCVSFGVTAVEAVRNAEEALSLHLEGMAEDNEPLPEPSSLDDLLKSHAIESASGDVVWVGVTVEAPDEPERVNLYLTKSLLERVDAHAKAAGVNRSAFFNQAARAFMTEVGERREVFYESMVDQLANRIAAGLVKVGATNVLVRDPAPEDAAPETFQRSVATMPSAGTRRPTRHG